METRIYPNLFRLLFPAKLRPSAKRFNNRIRIIYTSTSLFLSTRGEKNFERRVARREACGIVVRRHYPRSRYALVTREGPSFNAVHRRFRRQHRHTITFQTGETRFEGVSPNLAAALFHDESQGVPSPSMTRHWLPPWDRCDYAFIALLRIWLEERISSSRFFLFFFFFLKGNVASPDKEQVVRAKRKKAWYASSVGCNF